VAEGHMTTGPGALFIAPNFWVTPHMYRLNDMFCKKYHDILRDTQTLEM